MAVRKWGKGQLIEAFKSLGCRDPESWASSQVDEGIPQLHRFAFLKALWDNVSGPEDRYWVSAVRKQENDLPDQAAAAALDRMKKLGVPDEDIMHIVRVARAEQIFFIAGVIDDSGSAVARLGYDGDESLQWGLFAIDADGKPCEPIDSLHESVGDVGNRD